MLSEHTPNNTIGKGAGPTPQWRKKLSQLRAIEKTLRDRNSKHLGPRAQFAHALGMGAACLVMPILLVDSLLQGKLAFSLLWPAFGASTAAYLIGQWIGYRCNREPLTYTEKIDAQLACYEPVDLQSYRHLQDDVRRLNSIEDVFVEDWLRLERLAIELAAGFRRPVVDGFLRKGSGV